MTTDAVNSARATYSIDYWSDGYFDIDDQGRVVLIDPASPHPVPLVDVVAEARQQGLDMPLLIRFAGLLQERVKRLCRGFSTVMAEQQYPAAYTCVYPIKVNQQSRVVEEILQTSVADNHCQVGLEAGSKPELLAVLALSRKGNTIVCNGYKDAEFIRLALMGEKLGRRVFIVIEKFSELQLVLEQATQLGIRPRIGLRARLSSVGAGNWQNTGGEKSKFGLSASSILQLLDVLREANCLDCLQLLHFHLGSQISNIRDIQNAMKEAARYFAELNASGAAVNTVDVGGGLGVDYEGTRTRSYCSVNYTVHEYAAAIVSALKEVSEQAGLSCPDIITESGRALTAHHAVLVADVIGRESVLDQVPTPDQGASNIGEEPGVIRDLRRCYHAVLQHTLPVQPQAPKGPLLEMPLTELYHEVVYRFSEANEMYNYGVLNLHEKALAEALYFSACEQVRQRLNPFHRVHQKLFNELNEKLADKVFVNFSLFQSLPDVWGIDQVFPIMPLSQLDTPLTRHGVIQDITCDSDGRIDQYVDNGSLSSTLALPEPQEDETLLMGFFMVGAYQEILGDLHNLFGDTDSVVVRIDAEGSIQCQYTQKGDTVDTVLRYVNFEPRNLQQRFHQSLLSSSLSAAEQSQCLAEFNQGLIGYTYLE